MKRRHALVALASSAAASFGFAQAKPIRLIVPYPPGGPLDIVARALADKVRDSLGVVIVDNKAGAGGNLGADAAAKAAPDGSTLVMGAVATHAINPWLYAKIAYDPVRDFTPITGVAHVPNVLVMNPDAATRLGIRRVADLIAYAKQNPGKLNYGSGGNGSAGHLAGEMFKTLAGVFMVHIPYADNRRGRFGTGGLRCQHLVRFVRSGQVAAGDHAAFEHSVCRRPQFARTQGPPHHADGRADGRLACAVRRIRQDRVGEVPGCGQGQWGARRVGG
jgi:Tripartite tricarboxylate transporter family receptor